MSIPSSALPGYARAGTAVPGLLVPAAPDVIPAILTAFTQPGSGTSTGTIAPARPGIFRPGLTVPGLDTGPPGAIILTCTAAPASILTATTGLN